MDKLRLVQSLPHQKSREDAMALFFAQLGFGPNDERSPLETKYDQRFVCWPTAVFKFADRLGGWHTPPRPKESCLRLSHPGRVELRRHC
jgi:hypothetical protein